MLLSDVFNLQSIKLNLESKTKDEVFGELIESIITVRPELDRNVMYEALMARENKMNTAVVPGVAIPHACYPGIKDVIGAIGISRAGIEYDAPGNKPVYLILLFLMGEESREKHLDVLNKVFSILNSGAFKHIEAAKSSQEIYDILSGFR
jgi:mannitol/fructose-specific phosphotransferase system IIA component (Ntr-type)